jgi:hypothetical protein
VSSDSVKPTSNRRIVLLTCVADICASVVFSGWLEKSRPAAR